MLTTANTSRAASCSVRPHSSQQWAGLEGAQVVPCGGEAPSSSGVAWRSGVVVV